MKKMTEGNHGLIFPQICFIAAIQLVFLSVNVWAFTDDDCYSCHGSSDILEMTRAEKLEMVIPVTGMKRAHQGFASLYVDQERYSSSVHGDLGCTDCHTDISELPHKQYLAPVDCSMCHSEIAKQYKKSRHFKISSKPCWACHNPHEEIPVEELNQKQRVAICLRCHKGTSHDWLPQPETHFRYLECTVCHSPKATKGMFLQFCHLKDGKQVPMTYEEMAQALGESKDGLFKAIDVNGNGQLDPFEIKAALSHLQKNGFKSCALKEEILVTSPFHNFTYKVKNIKDCAMCHTSLSPFYETVQAEIPEKGKGFKKYPVSRDYLAKMPPIPNQHAYIKSVHAENGVTCLDCHSEFKVLRQEGKTLVNSPGIVVCAECHPKIMEKYKKSLHYRISKKICYNCHNPHAVEPFNQLTAEQRKDICQKCHTDALQKHKWLSQANLHFKYLECTMCHSPNASKGIVYHFRGITADGRTVRIKYEDLAAILGKTDVDIAKYINNEWPGRVSAFELASFLKTLNRHIKRAKDIKYIHLGVRLIVLKPVHNFTGKGLKAKECVVCHSADASFYSKVLLEVPQLGGGVQTLPLDRSVLTGVHGIGGVSDFYLLGEHRLTKQDLEELWYTIKSIGYRWIDIIGMIIVLGGIGFVGIHALVRIITRKNRR